MSGPKGCDYEVVSPQELLRREVLATRARAEAARRRIDVLRVRAASDVLSALAPLPAYELGLDLGGLQRAERDLLMHEAALEEALRQHVADAAFSALRDRAAELDLVIDLPDAVPGPPAHVADRHGSQSTGWSSRDTDRLARAVEAACALSAAAHAQAASVIEGVAAARAVDDGRRARMLVTHLETTVLRLAKEQREHDLVDASRRTLVAQSAALEETAGRLGDNVLLAEIRATVEQLRAAHSREEVERGRTQVESLAERARAGEDRAFVLEQSIAILSDLGYAVEASPSPSDVEPLVLTSSKWPRHALQMVLRTDRHAINTAPMTAGNTDPRDDLAFEQASCDDLARYRQELALRGVSVELVHDTAPGELALKQRAPSTARTGRSPRPRSMTRE